MKKGLKFASAILCGIMLLTGCSCNKENITKTTIELASEARKSYKVVHSDTLQEKIDNKDTFLLYVKNEYCGGCKIFTPIIKEVIQEKQLMVYAIEDSEFIQDGFGKIPSTPTLIIYSQGKEVYKLSYMTSEEYFDTKEGFLNFLDKYINFVEPKVEENK